ncbi:hypothetical protein C8T65DRAFT_643783 [Cerioporus squamosus]|nr:hypothetical protein C8T65DRAFT_643783 [Cerioporus squamosus]
MSGGNRLSRMAKSCARLARSSESEGPPYPSTGSRLTRAMGPLSTTDASLQPLPSHAIPFAPIQFVLLL